MNLEAAKSDPASRGQRDGVHCHHRIRASMKIHSFEHAPESEGNTCKQRFVFRLKGEGASMEISSLEVIGDSGCQGHPAMLSALLRGFRVKEVPVIDLACTRCNRDVSCGVHIANAIQEIRRLHEID